MHVRPSLKEDGDPTKERCLRHICAVYERNIRIENVTTQFKLLGRTKTLTFAIVSVFCGFDPQREKGKAFC